MIDNINTVIYSPNISPKYIAKVCSGDVEQIGMARPKSERVRRNYQLMVPVETGLTNGLGCTFGSERMVELKKIVQSGFDAANSFRRKL
jgi:hypothetical protein